MCKLSGPFKWDLQELLAQSSGKQQKCKEISCVLFMPKEGPSCDSTRKLGQCWKSKSISRLYMAYFARIHAETLQGRHENPWCFLKLASTESSSQGYPRKHKIIILNFPLPIRLTWMGGEWEVKDLVFFGGTVRKKVTETPKKEAFLCN